MIRKYASLQILEAWRGSAGPSSGKIAKTAHRIEFKYDARPGYLYVRSRMISSRTNDNHDTFPADEIEKGYRSFLGKPVFVNHHNANHRRARGVIVAVALHRDRNPDGTPDTWVEGLHEIDAVRFPRLCKAILAGRVNRTSMGVDVDWSTCSACGNKATSPAEYCRHLPAMKGKKIRARNKVTGKVEEKLVHEVCAGLSFFENSLLVEDPADPSAFVLGTPDARGLKDMSPRLARADAGDRHRGDPVLPGDIRQGELASPRASFAHSHLGQQVSLDDQDVSFGQAGERIRRSRQAAPLGHHVGRVDRVRAQEPVPHVHAQPEVARVADHQLRRDRAAQQFPSVAVRPDARAPRVRQGEARVAAVERPARPRVARADPWAEIDRRKETVYLGYRSDELSAHFRPADHSLYSTASSQTLREFGELAPHEQASVAQYHEQMIEEGNAHPSSTPRDYLYEPRQEPREQFLDRYMDADDEFKREYGPGDWEAHHQETLATHPIPRYPRENRWPLIVSDDNPNYVDDGYHRLHSYMRDAATEIPTVRMHPRTAVNRYQTYGGTHCLVCGEQVRVNMRKQEVNGGWHHHDGMKRDHPATPADPEGVFASIPGVDARRDQAQQAMREYLHGRFEELSGHPLPRKPRGDEGQMPPDPFLAARRKKQQGKPAKGYGGEPRFDGVGLKKDKRGFYVTTHRARSDSYPHPDDIPNADIDYIRSTGAREAEGGDHPWFENHPVHAHHIVASYHAATDDERALGDRWYNDAGDIAHVIGKGDRALGAGLLSAYSPRTLWPINMFNASRAAKGDPPGPGTGALGDHQRKAIRILAGEHHSKVLTAPKTAAFAHLIEHGGDSPEDVKHGTERVVIDRHAMSVAVGHRLSDEEYGGMPIGQVQHYDHVADKYREAAKHLSAHYGRKISPHQVQATTWLVQIRKNTEQDASGEKGAGGKGRVQMGDNSRRRWVQHHHHEYPGQVGEHNMHYHGALAEGGTHCAACGGDFSEPGHPQSAKVPMLCQGCLGRIGWKEDSAMPGYMGPREQRATVYGDTSRPMDYTLRQSVNSRAASPRLAYGETRMPPQVDTLRMDECPVCGEHNVWSGSRCPVCGFVVPPSVFRDPDTDRAKQVREQLDATGDVELPPDGQQAQAPQDAGLPLAPPAQIGSGDDADGQLVHPDQIAPDGVPTVQGGEGGPQGFDGQPPQDEEEEEVPPGPEGAVPPEDEALAQEEGSDDGEDLYAEELICPACGTTFETDAAAQPGVPCPACGMAALHPADEDGETPEEQEEDEAAEEETEEEDGAAPPEGAEDPSAEGEEPEDEQDEEDEDKDMPASKTAAALAQAQARRIAELSAQNEVLSAQLRYLASAAGIDRELAEVGRRVLRRQADILNPASPVPDPPQGPPSETTEQALQPESMDNPGRPGTTPGANSRVPAQQTTTAITPGVEMQTPPATNLIDVTQPVQGTNPSQDGGVPLEQRRIETDVRIDPDPLKAHGPGIGGQGDNGSAFPWILDAQGGGQQSQQGLTQAASRNEAEASRRTFASIRLAKLRVQAGLDQGEELAVAERIERTASLPTVMIEHEISTLEQLGRNGFGRPQQGRPVQRTAARQIPSLASVGASMQYAPAAADDLDASDLFD